MDNKKLLFVCSTSNTVINFRKELILFLMKRGYEIHLICGDNERKEEIKELGISSLHILKFSNRSKSLIEFVRTKKQIKAIIGQIRPACVLTFQAKPNIVTAYALKDSDTPLLSFVEGLGILTKKSSIARVTSRMYHKAFKRINKAFVLNHDDREYLLNNNYLTENKIVLINGIGINYRDYDVIERFTNKKNVLMLSRLALDKGILNYCEIAKLVRKTRKDINFYLYGWEENLSIKKLQPYIYAGDVIYNGFSKDVKTLFKDFRVFALPSNIREGVPRTLMEASSSGLPCIAYDIVGSKEVVIDNETGHIVENNNIQAFANKLIQLIDDENKLKAFGMKARKYCEERFDSEIINSKILEVIESI